MISEQVLVTTGSKYIEKVIDPESIKPGVVRNAWTVSLAVAIGKAQQPVWEGSGIVWKSVRGLYRYVGDAELMNNLGYNYDSLRNQGIAYFTDRSYVRGRNERIGIIPKDEFHEIIEGLERMLGPHTASLALGPRVNLHKHGIRDLDLQVNDKRIGVWTDIDPSLVRAFDREEFGYSGTFGV